LRKLPGRRLARSNLVWVVGVAAGLIAGSIVAYGVASTTTSVAVARR
jgi:hypothetical protein